MKRLPCYKNLVFLLCCFLLLFCFLSVGHAESNIENAYFTIERSINPVIVKSGNTVTVSYTVNNISNYSLSDIAINENISKTRKSINGLKPNESAVLSFSSRIGRNNLISNANISYKVEGDPQIHSINISDHMILVQNYLYANDVEIKSIDNLKELSSDDLYSILAMTTYVLGERETEQREISCNYSFIYSDTTTIYLSAVNQSPNSTSKKDLGMWTKKYYIDEFKQKTSKAYITNQKKINGTFSNSAVTDYPLSVDILIDADKASIMLYEYSNRLVKTYGTKNYKISILAPDGSKERISGIMYSDRIIINSKNLETLYEILKQNGIVRFVVTESDYSINEYSFTIENSSFFEDAYDELFH